MNNSIVLTVSEVTEEIKATIENSPLLSSLTVKGELTGFVRSSSGHLYFSLKDDGAIINCVMFRSAASKIKFDPENGQMVEVAGRIGLFEKRGSYQLYCYTMKPEGLGDLYLAFIRLKEKLEKQGCFDREKKKALPHAPARVGVITSLTGAAARDFFNVSRRRDPGLDIVFADALVQGVKSAQSVITALKGLESLELDVIVITRGGGAYEELMPFNDEAMAMEIIACKTPIVAAIGHETDTVIAELVADLRASTPSAAAELISQNRLEIIKRYEDRKRALLRVMMNTLEMNRSNLRRFDIKSMGRRLEIRLEQAAQEVDLSVHKIKSEILNRFQDVGSRLEKNDALLQKLNPQKLLSRGYAWIEKPLLKTPVVSCKDVDQNEIISVRLADGNLTCHVDEINKNKKRSGGS